MPKLEDNTVYVGIDPGISGGIACITSDGSFSVSSIPKTEEGIWYYVQSLIRGAYTNPIRVAVELVGGYLPLRKGEGGGKERNTGSSMFKFGMSYGGLRMALIGCGLVEGKDWKTVHPATWQKQLGVPSRGRGEKKEAHKRKLREFASNLFPEVSVTLKTCDALLIAEYCRRDCDFLFPKG